MVALMLFSLFANRLRPVGVLLKFMRTSMALLAIYALAGCATTLSARVTSFQKWPGGVQGETYRLVRGADQPDSLGYQTSADMVRASIGPVGLVEAQAGGQARFAGSFRHGDTQDHEWVTRYDAHYFPGGDGAGR